MMAKRTLRVSARLSAAVGLRWRCRSSCQALASRLWWLRFSTDQCWRTAPAERVFSCAERLERKKRVWVFWVWSGAFFSDQSRWTVMAERAPGSPALPRTMAARGRHRDARPDARARPPGSGQKGGCLEGLRRTGQTLGGIFFGADEIIAAFFQDDTHGVLLVVERISGDQRIDPFDLGIGQKRTALGDFTVFLLAAGHRHGDGASRSEERRVGKECRSRW